MFFLLLSFFLISVVFISIIARWFPTTLISRHKDYFIKLNLSHFFIKYSSFYDNVKIYIFNAWNHSKTFYSLTLCVRILKLSFFISCINKNICLWKLEISICIYFNRQHKPNVWLNQVKKSRNTDKAKSVKGLFSKTADNCFILVNI